MSAQDNMEKVLRELHVLLSKSNPYERDSNYLVVNKKEMLDILKQLAVCMSEVMDEYELTQQGREQAQRENRKIGEEIINDARAKAEDVYAASVMYTDEALRRILDIMDEANESVKAVYDSMGEKLAECLWEYAHSSIFSGGVCQMDRRCIRCDGVSRHRL